MVIEDRNLAVGTLLTATYKGQEHSCEVIQTETGVGFRLSASGKGYGSPSAAGSAVMGGVACNGWRFWSRAGVGTVAVAASTASRKKTVPGLMRQIRKLPNQRGVPEGKVKWHCSACMASFVAEGAGDPEACPEGHPREVVDGWEAAPPKAAALGALVPVDCAYELKEATSGK